MSDDIVTRLRKEISKRDRPYPVELLPELREAADEMERLRRNTGCARNQGTTQFCAEALDAQREVETLKAELVRNADEFRETITELRQRIETLTDERDEARRLICDLSWEDSREVAKQLDWDCFKEEQ